MIGKVHESYESWRPAFAILGLISILGLIVSGCDTTRHGGGESAELEAQGGGATTMSTEETSGQARDPGDPGELSELSDAEWKAKLTPEEYRILRKKGTERAFTGDLWDSKKEGVYVCAGCTNPLFDSSTKFDSGTGWPSYWQPIADGNVATETDKGFFMVRTEVLCARCGGHLGHVFDDGPAPTNLRYCINSAALDFVDREGESGDATKSDVKTGPDTIDRARKIEGSGSR